MFSIIHPDTHNIIICTMLFSSLNVNLYIKQINKLAIKNVKLPIIDFFPFYFVNIGAKPSPKSSINNGYFKY